VYAESNLLPFTLRREGFILLAPSNEGSSEVFALLALLALRNEGRNARPNFPLQDYTRPSAHHSLNSLESALAKNSRVTRLESALTKMLRLKSFRIRTYKKWRGEGANC
jgi:hypothetical protein